MHNSTKKQFVNSKEVTKVPSKEIVYVLKCKNEKYYVGKTSLDINIRLGQLQRGEGSVWTKRHPPVKIVENFDSYNYAEEQKTLEYMQKFGINNVRGGRWASIDLSEKEMAGILESIGHEVGKCYKCGIPGHFADVCPQKPETTKISEQTVKQMVKQMPRKKSHRVIIYVLKCKNEKYYVGKTSQDIKIRFEQHQRGVGSFWTRKYPPVKIVETIPYEKFAEDHKTIQYMEKYGIDKVRGGKWSAMDLSKEEVSEILRSFAHEDGQCYLCSLPGHFANACPQQRRNLTRVNQTRSMPYNRSKPRVQSRSHAFGCANCGRDNHWENNCIASTDIYGNCIARSNFLPPPFGCFRCGRDNHWAYNCIASTDIYGNCIE